MLTHDQIAELHSRYEDLTGYRLPLTIPRQDAWQQWVREVSEWIRHAQATGPGTQLLTIRACLDALVAERRRQYREKPAMLAAVLKFGHLVHRPEDAVSDLAVWHGARRARRSAAAADPARRATLAATGRTEAPREPDPNILAALGKARQEIGL